MGNTALHEAENDSLLARKTRRVHSLAYPIDTHLDSLYVTRLTGCDFWAGDWRAKQWPLSMRLITATAPRGKNVPHFRHVGGPDFLHGGYGGACFAAHALWENLFGARFGDPWSNWLTHRDYVHEIVGQSHGRLRLANTPQAVRAAWADGVASAILAVEGAHVLGGNGASTQAKRLARLGELAKSGAAYVTLNHFSHTDICRSGYLPMNPWRKGPAGLSAFGRDFVEHCMELGLLIDVSHTADQAIIETAELCLAHGVPLLASHAASRTVSLNGGQPATPPRYLDRTLSDAAIRAIVETGGTISIILAPIFLNARILENGKPCMDVDLEYVVNYYERLASLIATMHVTADPWDHLSFGSDFDGGISSIPTGMQSGTDLIQLTRAMLAAGWPEERICRVYSGNFLRVWQGAKSASALPQRVIAPKQEPEFA
ncbi:membrane dipeptidase [Allorhizobium undicola]|uniref:membrane dipeptidase n=1 Tax=Allorhizobium undicola TaxID=78527 RepID=UPI0006852AF1|nr:membrane dipeptidase [Allorhizobium undicola]